MSAAPGPGPRYRGPRLDLSTSERRALLAAAAGLGVAESARLDGVSTNAIRSRRAMALRRLGARNVAHALALALAHGQLTVRDLDEALRSQP